MNGENTMKTADLFKYPNLAKSMGFKLSLTPPKDDNGEDNFDSLTEFPLLQKSMDDLKKSMSFPISGKKLKVAIDKKIAECKGELKILEKEYPPVAIETKVAAEISTDVAEGTVAATKDAQVKFRESWEVRSKKRQIEYLETCHRNIVDSKTYELDKYELKEFGL